jgi:hypothetical protein
MFVKFDILDKLLQPANALSLIDVIFEKSLVKFPNFIVVKFLQLLNAYCLIVVKFPSCTSYNWAQFLNTPSPSVVTFVPINLFSPDPSNVFPKIVFIFVNFNVFPFNPVFLNAHLLRGFIENVYSVLSFI